MLLSIDLNDFYKKSTYDLVKFETYYEEYKKRIPFKYELDYEYLKIYLSKIKEGVSLERITPERLERILIEQYKLKYYNNFENVDITVISDIF